MPINFPSFPIGQTPVPIPGRPQPIQQPQHFDPASIIMEAFKVKQQRDLQQQQLAQKGFEDAMGSIQAAQSLQEKKRESQAHEELAQQTLQMAQGKLPMEQAEMTARANFMQAQANMYSQNMSGDAAALLSATQPGPNGEKPKMSFEQAVLAAKGRGPAMQAAFLKAVADSVRGGANMMTGTAALAGTKQGAVTEQSPAFQMPIRMASAVLPSLNLLDHLADKLPRTDLQWLNKGGIAALKSNGSVIGQAVATQTNNFLQAYNQQFGRGTDKKIDMDADSISSAQSPAQLKMSLALTKGDIIAKRNSLMGPEHFGYSAPSDNQMAPVPTFKAKDYLNSLGQDFSPSEALHSLMTAREAGLIQD